MRTRKFLLSVLAGLVLVVPLLLPTPADATPAPASTAPAAATWTLLSPFSREVVRPGDTDASPYAIEHVRELQYRLKWAGYFSATPTGWFGPITKAALIKFQKAHGIPATGVAGYATWRTLIPLTVRGRSAVPAACRSAGWHACYDRSRHQVNLYHAGALLNSWLVRGGGITTPTRTGSYVVFYRDIDHWSSKYDTPMPYSQFFDGGQALHGSRLMMDPFVGHSHGCVNFWVEDARQLWNLTSTVTLHVHVYGAWG